MKTIIIGLGNPSFSDDGVGSLIAQAIKDNLPVGDTTVVEASSAGLDILDLIADFEKAIIIDAVQTQAGKPGSIYRFDINQLSSLEEGGPHNFDFLASIYLGKKLGLNLPAEIIVFGIEAQNIDDPNEGCTPPVNAAISLCVEKIIAELNNQPVLND